LGRSCGNFLQGNVGIASRRIIRIRFWRVDSKFPWRIIIKKRLVFAIARKSEYSPFEAIVFHNGCYYALLGIFCDLALKFGILPRLLLQKPVNETQIQIIGVGVGVAARVSGTISRALIALVIPHIGLYGHKELAYIGCLAVVDVGHEPLDIGERRRVHLAKAAVGNSGFENGIGVCIGSRGIGKRIAV